MKKFPKHRLKPTNRMTSGPLQPRLADWFPNIRFQDKILKLIRTRLSLSQRPQRRKVGRCILYCTVISNFLPERFFILCIFFCVVIRFTKEEMMTFRQPAKLLTNMAEMVEVISLDRLNPVCFERFEPEDVSITVPRKPFNVS